MSPSCYWLYRFLPVFFPEVDFQIFFLYLNCSYQNLPLFSRLIYRFGYCLSRNWCPIWNSWFIIFHAHFGPLYVRFNAGLNFSFSFRDCQLFRSAYFANQTIALKTINICCFLSSFIVFREEFGYHIFKVNLLNHLPFSHKSFSILLHMSHFLITCPNIGAQ